MKDKMDKEKRHELVLKLRCKKPEMAKASIEPDVKNSDSMVTELKVDGDVGNKKIYDPRVYMKLAEASMADRVKRAVEDLRSAGTTIYKA